jgi:TPR repeat protein
MNTPKLILFISCIAFISTDLKADVPSLKELRQRAESGDVNSQLELGNRYSVGSALFDEPINIEESLRWYKKAADQNDVGAQLKLARIYDNGINVPPDHKSALYWYCRAAEEGNPASRIIIINRAESGDELAKPFLKELQNNDANYIVAINRNAVNFVRPIKQWSAMQGNSSEEFNLALAYQIGTIIETAPKNTAPKGLVLRDSAQALAYYLKAATQNHARAQYNLGMIYYNGDGVLRNYGEALQWFEKAAEQEHTYAQNHLGIMHLNGEGTPIDFEKSLKWFHKSAKQDNASAQNNLGVMYSKGIGYPKDRNMAIKFFQQSADNGLSDAQVNLNALGVRKDEIPDPIINFDKTMNTVTAATPPNNRVAKSAPWDPVVYFAIIAIPIIWFFFRSTRSNQDNDAKPEEYDDQSLKPEPEYLRHATILGLKGKVTISDVKKAYKEQLTKYHPDKVNHLGEDLQKLAKERTNEIIAAYEHFKHKHDFE